MIRTLLQAVIFGFIILTSCSRNDSYKFEGKLSNLDQDTLFVVFENEKSEFTDTVLCDEKGVFTFEQKQIGFNTATFFLNGKTKYFIVYLNHEGDKIKIKGNASYPGLVEIKGNRLNNELTKIKKQMQPLLEELQNIRSKIVNMATNNNIEEADLISRQANIRMQIMEVVLSYIKDHPKEEASAVLIQLYYLNPDSSQKLDELLNGLDSSLKNFYIVRSLRKFSEKVKQTEIGAEAPKFTAENVFGEEVGINEKLDKYMLLAFTAPWNDRCHTEELALDKIKSDYPEELLDIILISLDDNSEQVRKALKADSIKWNLITDSASQSMTLMDLYNVRTLPKCFLIDKEGKIILKTFNSIEIRKALDKVINEVN